MKKDDLIQVTIEDLSSEGLGIGKCEGIVVFIKDTVIGDTVQARVMKMKKTYGYARLEKILQPSPDRIEPRCPIARPCGGCQIQAMSYPAQLRFKEEKVRGNLVRIGGFDADSLPMETIIGMDEPFRYRNKAQYPVGRDRSGRPTAGFYAGHTHTIISCEDCLIGQEENKEILARVLSYMETCHVPEYQEESGRGIIRHVMIRSALHSGQIMVCIVAATGRLPKEDKLCALLAEIPGMTSIVLNTNIARTNVILGPGMRTLWGSETITETLGTVNFSISAHSFFQVNTRQTEKLYGKALEYAALTGKETVWDLYCGIGTISLFLARKARQVYGVEVVPAAIEDARKNALDNHITNASFFVGKAEEVLPEKYNSEHIYADVIVVDPPRKGCEQSVLDTMICMAPSRIVYVSCDSATLARDLKYLRDEGGYIPGRICPVDMFGNTVHVETVVQLHRAE